MITVNTAEKALKTVYLGVIGNQLNIGVNPLLSKIKQTNCETYGNEIVRPVSYGVSGGVSAAPDGAELPKANSRNYLQFRSTLKNLFGTLEISDKALRCSQGSAGAFVNLLNDEMENLIKSSSYQLGRMLYGNGRGLLGKVAQSNEVAGEEFVVEDLRFLAPNSSFKMTTPQYQYLLHDQYTILSIDRETKTITVDRPLDQDYKGYCLASVSGLDHEITGIEALFDHSAVPTVYGIKKANYPWMKPYQKNSVGDISEVAIQSAIDQVEEMSGGTIDFISCSAGVRRAYQECLSSMRRNIDVLNLDGGFKAISYCGIPLIADKFVKEGEMYLLNTKDFELCQLGDWQWLEGDNGKIIRRKDNYAAYQATLVKYAELFCNRPSGQAKLTGITVA